MSPSGNAACAIWVHDETPGHVDLIGSNHGRVLLASFFDKGSGTWSAPASILAKESDYDEFYPAILEPSVTLSGDRDGLVSFTAVAAASPETDTGLGGGSRFLYIVHLESGVFGPPILIGGKCGLRQTGHWIKAFHDIFLISSL